jgi:hypothetical protein
MRRGASEEIDLVEFARCFTERAEGSREQDAAWTAGCATRWDEAEVAAARLLEGIIIITTRTAHSKALIVRGTGFNDVERGGAAGRAREGGGGRGWADGRRVLCESAAAAGTGVL